MSNIEGGNDLPALVRSMNQKDILSSHNSMDISADYTIGANSKIKTYYVTTGSSIITITLPPIADCNNKNIEIIKIDSGTGYVVIDGNVSETLDYIGIQQATITIELQNRGICIKANDSSWIILYVTGAEILDISGVLELVYENIYKGIMTSSATTNVAHNIADYEKIIQVTSSIKQSSTFYEVYSYATGASATFIYYLRYDATNINLSGVGASLYARPYILVAKYYI